MARLNLVAANKEARAPRVRATARPVPVIVPPSNDDQKDHFITKNGLSYAGSHLIIDLWEAEGLADRERIETALIDAVNAAGANQVTVYQGGCPLSAMGRMAVHPKAVESAYSVINRYPNETPTSEIAEAHFLIDRSGYVRARFRHFEPGDGMAAQLREQIATMAKEPFVVISLHSH